MFHYHTINIVNDFQAYSLGPQIPKYDIPSPPTTPLTTDLNTNKDFWAAKLLQKEMCVQN